MNNNELQTAIQQAEEVVQEHYHLYMSSNKREKDMHKHGYQAALRRLNKLLERNADTVSIN